MTGAPSGRAVERIAAPSPAVLEHEYLRRPVPVILLGALQPRPGTPAMGDRAGWTEQLAALPLQIRSGSVEELLLTGGASGERRVPFTFAAFCVT